MTFVELIRWLRMPTVLQAEIGRDDVYYFHHDGENAALVIDLKKVIKLSPGALDILRRAKNSPFLVQMDLMIATQIFGKGPKIFRPTAYQLSMLEQMTLNLSMADFNVPYETMIIELPDEYIKERCKEYGENLPINLSILHVNKRHGLFSHSIWQEQSVIKSWIKYLPEMQMEEWMASDWYGEANANKVDAIPTSKVEANLETLIRRAVLNYCLLLDETGTKQVGTAYPNQYAQLVKHLAKKPNAHTERNKLELLACPVFFQIDQQNIVLARTESEPKEYNETGRKVRPHSRRGYYRMQPHGPGNLLRKRVRIPPVFVNMHLAINPQPQMVTYVSPDPGERSSKTAGSS